MKGKIWVVESFEDTRLDVSITVKLSDVSNCGDNFEFFFKVSVKPNSRRLRTLMSFQELPITFYGYKLQIVS